MLTNGEGLVMGIINGFGSMANRYIEQDDAVEKAQRLAEIQRQVREQEMRTQKELELEFAPQKAQVDSDIAEAERQKRVGIVNQALEDRAVNAVQNKYADPVMGDTQLSEEQQAVLNQGMAQNVRDREKTRQDILNSSMERMKATQDAGLKPDSTVVTAENKEEALAIKEAGIKAAEAKLQAKIEQDRAERERREKQGERTDALKTENLKLIGERNDNARISGLQSLITREEQNQEKIRQNFTAQYSKSIDAQLDPATHAKQVNDAFMASPQYKASEKRLEDLNGRLSKALEEKPKATEATQSSTPARTNPSGVATPVTQADYDALPSGASYFKDGKIYKKR